MLMIGRGVFENPYCFTEHEPIQTELLDLLRYHLELFDLEDGRLKAKRAMALGDGGDTKVRRGLAFDPLKHYFKIYVHGFPGASELRAKMMECKNTAEVREVLKGWVSMAQNACKMV